jgi:hypothetical protein
MQSMYQLRGYGTPEMALDTIKKQRLKLKCGEEKQDDR